MTKTVLQTLKGITNSRKRQVRQYPLFWLPTGGSHSEMFS
jgi:hypothetical protein